MTHPTKSRSRADPASAFSVLLTSLKALQRNGVEHKGLEGKISPCLWRKELWAAAEPMRMGRWLLLAGLVVAALLPAVQSMGPREPGDTSRWQPNAPQSTRNLKRHSEGTFSSDLTRHLDSMRAKDFVHWLINTKRYSSTKRFLKDWPRSGSSESAPKAKVQ